ncbi:Alcohol oxidase [Cytospora mali]|uniref:Alcohol oxidase n=1 Tax=Cytospora mali TaxID=578113 RepID=A0A194W9W6_CYTMA|nr:Alcohol oxidase [Valsa mali]
MAALDASFDVVIIGGGTAGLALAARLSENPSVEVAVLEAGEDMTSDPRVSIPAMWPRTLNSDIDWAFKTTEQSALGGRQLDCPAGRALGGTSSINSFLVSPTSKSHIDAWSRLGNPGWDWSAFSTAVSKACSGGSVHLKGPNLDEPENGWLKVWADTIGTLGYPTSNDPFSGKVSGAVMSPESINPTTGKRCSSANAYLEPARQRPNLTVISGATVSKILFDKNVSSPDDAVAEGVQYTIVEDGETKTAQVKARKEVVLAAGALSSPRLLEISGIGNAALLQDLGIQAIVDNPHVGENLQNHILVGTTFEVQDDSDLPSRDPLNRQEPAVVEAATAAYAKGQGPLATCGTNAYAQLPFPEIETAVGREAVDTLVKDALDDNAISNGNITPAFAAAHAAFVRSVLTSPADAPIVYIAANTFVPYDADPTIRPPGRHFSITSILAHPLSHGSVHITATSPDAPNNGVAVDPRFLSHPLDSEVLVRSLRYIEQRMAKAEPLAGHLKPQEARFEDVEAAKEYIRRTVRGGNHWVGSCSMMPREMGGVVDAQLRVYGCKNLRCGADCV